MKQHITLLFLLFLCVSGISQTVIPLPGFQAVLKEFPTMSDDTITAQFSITDFSNQWRGQDLNDREHLVLWRNCKRYPIIEVVQAFSTEVIVKLNKDGNPNLLPGVCALLQETPGQMVSHLISGITDSDKQCIDSYYRVDALADTTNCCIDTSVTNELQTLSTSGAAGNISISSGNTITLNVNDADSNPSNELQTLSTNGSAGNISISSGNMLTLNINDADANSSNEGRLGVSAEDANASRITSNTTGANGVRIAGSNTVKVTETTNSNGGSINFNVDTAKISTIYYVDSVLSSVPSDPDSIQRVGNVISLRDGSGSVNVSDLVNAPDSTIVVSGTGINVVESPDHTFTVNNTAPDQTVTIGQSGIVSVAGTYPNFTVGATEVDGSVTNELQTISTTGAAGNISISSGNTITLNVNDADSNPSNEIQTIDTFSIVSNKLRLSLTQDAQIFRSVDLSPYINTDAQTLSRSGLDLSISGGNTVSFPTSNGSTTGWLTGTDWTTFNNKVGGSGAANKLAFWTGTSTLSQNNNLHYDNANSKLGLGITSSLNAWLNINGQSGIGYSKALEIQSPGGWVTSWIKSYNSSGPDQRGLSFGGIQAGGTDYDHLLVLNNFSTQGVGIKTQYPLTDLHVTTPYAGSSNNGIRHDHNSSFWSVRQINSEGDIIFRSTSGNMSVGPLSTTIQDLNPSANIHLFATGGFGENEIFKLEKAGGWGFTTFNQYVISGGNRGLKLRDSYGGTAIFTTEQISKRIGINQETPETTLHVGGNLTVNTRTGTPASLAAWTSGGVAATANLGVGLSFTGTDVVATDPSTSNELITAVTSGGLLAGGNTLVITEAGVSRTGIIFPMTGATAGTAGVQGVVPAPAAGQNNHYLRGDGTWQTISSGVTGSGTATQVAYWNGTSSLTGNSNLFWNNTNIRLGIGTSGPTQTLHVNSSSGAYTNAKGILMSHGSATQQLFVGHTGATQTQITMNESNFAGNSGIYINSNGAQIGIKTPSATRDLDVNGNARIRGAIYDTGDSPGTAGQTIKSAGTGAFTWGDNCTVEIFTTPGTYNWVKPANCKAVYVKCIGGGGGGAGGNKGAAGVFTAGGEGGDGGGVSEWTFNESELILNNTVIVGAGGTGGAGATLNNSNGAGGTDGENSVFKNIIAEGGRRGNPSLSKLGMGIVEDGGYGARRIDDTTSEPASVTKVAGCGGGGGGSISSADVIIPVVPNGETRLFTGSFASPTIVGSFGGAAGAASTTGNGTNGSTPGSSKFGGGGGGGGAARNSVGNGGNGGNGRGGAVLIITYF